MLNSLKRKSCGQLLSDFYFAGKEGNDDIGVQLVSASYQ